MDQTWVPVISGAVGAGGAILAQAASAIFTARREKKKLEWDKSVLEREWHNRTLERFDDVKTKVYAEYLSLLYATTHEVLMARPPDLDQFSPESKQHYRKRQDLPRRPSENYYAIARLKAQIQILSLPVGEYAQTAFATYAKLLDNVLNTEITDHAYFELYGKAIIAWDRLLRVMRQDLAGEEITRTKAMPTQAGGHEA